jgi:hypothetical protein
MTTFKNLEIIKATLLEKKEATGKLVAVLNQEAKDEQKQLFETIFESELAAYPEVTITSGYSGIYFNIGNKEIGSLYHRSYYNNSNFYFNTYSTIIDNEFEYKRLIFNGKLADKILHNQESIQAAFKIPFSKESELTTLQEEIYAIEREISDKENQAQELRKQEVMAKLMGEGMEYQPGHTFEFNRQWSSSQIKKVRIVEATKSGKTVTLEVTYVRYKWIDDENGGSMRVSDEDAVVTYEKIKMDYIMDNFRKYIYNH